MQVHNSPDITLGWLASEALTLALPALGPGGANRVFRKCLGAMRVAPGSWVVTCSGKLTAGIWKDAFLLLIYVTVRAGTDPSLASKSSYSRSGAAESLGSVWPKGADVERVVTWSHTHVSILEDLFYGKAVKAGVHQDFSGCRSWWLSQFHVTVLSQADPEVLPGLKADTEAWSPDVPPSPLSSRM